MCIPTSSCASGKWHLLLASPPQLLTSTWFWGFIYAFLKSPSIKTHKDWSHSLNQSRSVCLSWEDCSFEQLSQQKWGSDSGTGWGKQDGLAGRRFLPAKC